MNINLQKLMMGFILVGMVFAGMYSFVGSTAAIAAVSFFKIWVGRRNLSRGTWHTNRALS